MCYAFTDVALLEKLPEGKEVLGVHLSPALTPNEEKETVLAIGGDFLAGIARTLAAITEGQAFAESPQTSL